MSGRIGDKDASRMMMARLAIAEKMVSESTVARVMDLMDAAQSEIPFGELLVRLGHITSAQLKKLTALEDAAAVRREEPREDAELFGQAAIARRWVTAEQVAEALKDQAALAGRGDFRNLGELLIARGVLTSEQVKALLTEQEKVIMVCPGCGEKYNVLQSWESAAKCPADGTLLTRIGNDSTVGVAATLGTPAAETESPIGMECGGCRIVELIAKGSMGAVYKAKHVGLNRYVAVKLLPSVSKNPDLVKRLLIEARAVAKLEHVNIVQVYDVGFHRGYFFIVMQLLNGQTLEERLAEMGSLPVDSALEIARDVAGGLGAAHAKGIVHRDVKPANVMLTEDGRARLTDFGLAQDVDNPEKEAGLIVGTPYYMSPEQWLGHKADERSDLYSLGVILYQMLTGRRPFEGATVNELMHQHLKVAASSPKKIDSGLSDGLCAIVKKLLAKPPAKRYPNAAAFLDDLKKVTAGEEPEAMGEFGALVKCGFCESFNPVTESRCKVCGESLHAAGGPLEIAARPDEFKCPGCGELNSKKSRHCAGCGKPFCTRCRRRLAVLRGHCHECMPHLRRR
jgi:tRNA A-37 threonylcarbamoyl transferase component Bud32